MKSSCTNALGNRTCFHHGVALREEEKRSDGKVAGSWNMYAFCKVAWARAPKSLPTDSGLASTRADSSQRLWRRSRYRQAAVTSPVVTVARGKASDPARWISLSDYCLYERAVSIALSADFLVLAHDCVQLQSIGSTCRESTGWKASGRLGDTLRRRTGKCDSIFTASVIVFRISNHTGLFTCTVACVAS